MKYSHVSETLASKYEKGLFLVSPYLKEEGRNVLTIDGGQ